MQKTTELTMEQVNRFREECKEPIAMADALDRLHNNADFQLVFVKNYGEKEPARLVHMLGEASQNTQEKKEHNRQELQECMIGIARFSEYCRSVYYRAFQAKKTLDNLLEAEKEFYSSGSNDTGEEITTNS